MILNYGKITPLNKVASTVGIFDLYFELIALINSFAKSAFPLGFRLIPSNEFSSNQFEYGGYGLFGFEFFMNKCCNYFIEIGGVGTGATANKIVLQPIYSNGLLISSGFRMQLK